MEFSNQLPNFDISIFDDEQNERIHGRFVPMTDSEVDNLIDTEEFANTERKTLYDLNFVKQFLTEHGERRSIEEIPAVELNNYLSKFIFAARTKKGEENEPSSLRGIFSGVERHLSCADSRVPIMGNLLSKIMIFKRLEIPLKQNRKN
ncbi:unnamed protein product [Porites evermanni]|uniref:Uncharacterized protein n=1 Tax=Porites evermanni TaxID=104178 RepID=A0ABN8PIY4_9CNID|nr:unnamed protein product [Porites evermanni]